jgi:hypothetical protein
MCVPAFTITLRNRSMISPLTRPRFGLLLLPG